MMQEMLAKGMILPPETEPILNQYKEPLKPVEKGFGYLGTIAFNKDETHTQCHICGYFFKQLGRHVTNQHDMKVIEYRDKFRLARQTSLVASETRQKYVKRYANLSSDEKLAKITSLTKAASVSREKSITKNWNKGISHSLELKNKEGRCPDQLLEKIEQLSKKLGKTPTGRQFSGEYGGGYYESIKTTFGSWSNAVKICGLTVRTPGHYYDERTLKVMLWDFKERYGREPYSKDLSLDRVGATHGPYYRVFGSFTKAKDIAFGRTNQLLTNLSKE